jgi:hypothetical protein
MGELDEATLEAMIEETERRLGQQSEAPIKLPPEFRREAAGTFPHW